MENKKKPHEWTNADGDVLLVRFVDLNYQSYNGFQWPKEIGAEVKPDKWDATTECGNGIHGWPWGLSMGDGKEPIFTDAIWQVVAAKPDDLVDLGGKVKAKKVKIVYQGSWWKALSIVEPEKIKWTEYASSGSASATGWSGSASATGWSGSASATGASGSASATGASGSASATGGRGSASATGGSGSASATGASGSASATGERGSASATGGSGSASATGASGSASATGARGSASATGERGSASATGERGSASATGGRGSASATGESGSASATGASGSASATGWRAAATTTLDYSTVECGKGGIAASTASIVTWIAHPGAVFVQRWTNDVAKKSGVKVCTFGGMKASDGERITFENGKVIKRVKM